jgi:hypothetical protein
MGLGIALVLVGVLGTAAFAAVVAAVSSAGLFGLETALGADPRTAVVVAGALAAMATAAFFLGAARIGRTRSRRAHLVVVDERAQEAERDARARLLAMRLEQLQREVEGMEQRASAFGLLETSAAVIDGDDGEEPVVVLLPDDDREPTVLGRRLAEAARKPSPRE